jgi:hypothetical protein
MGSGSWRTLCSGDYWGKLAEIEGEVTCLRCMYHLGLYVPLSRLAEHKMIQRLRADRREMPV